MRALTAWQKLSCSQKILTVLIHSCVGKGFFKYKARSSAEYYFAYGNLGRRSVHLTTNFEVKSLVYDTREARRSCSSGVCTFQLEYGGEEAEVIVTPDASGVRPR